MKNFYIYMPGSFKFFKGVVLPDVTDRTCFCSLSPCRLFTRMPSFLFSRRVSLKYSSTYSVLCSSKVCKSSFFQRFQVVVPVSEFLSARPSSFSSHFERSLLVANSVSDEIHLKFPGLPRHFDVAFINYASSSRKYFVDIFYKVVQEIN